MRTLSFRVLIVALLVLAFIAGISTAFADPFDDALAAYDRQEYGKAFQLMRPLKPCYCEMSDVTMRNARRSWFKGSISWT